jgi:hypothetical protein
MTPRLQRETPFHALQEALTAVEALLVDKGIRPVEERGA